MLGGLLDGQLVRLLEHRRLDAMGSANPLDHFRRVRLVRGTGMPFSIELVGDLGIDQAMSQISDAADNRGRIPQAVCYVGRELNGQIGAGASLPAGCEPRAAFDWRASRR